MHHLINKKLKIYFYFLIFSFLSTFYNPNIQNFSKKIFKIKNIYVSPAKINIIGINKLYDQNILKIDFEIVNKIFENNPFIKYLQIRKIYPDTLRVNFVPSDPIAKIYINNKINYLGDNGKIFRSKTIKNFIPLIKGENDVEKSLEIIKLLEISPFKLKNIKIIKIYPTKRFDLMLYDKTILKFPIQSDLKTVEKAYSFLKNNSIKLRTIDLRIQGKIIINDK